jgi:TnpA family transposase
MPVEFLSDQQVATYGRFAGPPTRTQLERCFLLNDIDRALVEQRRGDHNRLGFAVQLGTVRFLGTFLTDPLVVPSAVVEYVAAQLGIGDSACFGAYADRAKTPYEHAWEIRRAYGYRDLAEAEVELRDFLAARAATATEGPRALFDRVTAWLIERKVLLPGVTILARLIVAARAAASERLWRLLTDGVDPALRQRLQRLLDAEEGSRYSALERLRRSPFRISGPELARALERVAEIQRLGVSAVDCSAAAPNRLASLARHGLVAKVPQFRQLTEPRRSATLLATLRQLERVAVDDALDLFDVLMTTKLLARAARESAKEQLRALPRFAAASVTLAAAVQVLLATPTAEAELSWTEVWTAIEHVAPRQELTVALAAVLALAPPSEATTEAIWHAELVLRYPTIRPFLPLLGTVIPFGAVDGSQEIVTALQRLPTLLGRKKVRKEEIAAGLVTGAWRRLVYAETAGEPGVVDHRAYAFCVLEHFQRALHRRDVFALQSDRWGDPRARLLEGAAWQETRPAILTALRLPEQPDQHLDELADKLDAAYRDLAARLPDHPALELTHEGERLSLGRLEAEPEPPSLVALRTLIAGMLPRVDLPDLLLEVHDWTGCFDECTHLSEANARMADLPLSVAAVLIAEACNIGFRPVSSPSVSALTRDRLSHVDQNYVRAETLRAANGRLIDAQGSIPLASAWGGGLVASADGLRFVVPIATLNAGPNPRYFGMQRGATWLNAVNDQAAGIGAIVVPGTMRDSLHILDLLLNIEGGPRPDVVVTDTASYSDIVFGLFRILGYQFSPRIADLTDTRFWRLNASADYGPLNAVARSRVNRQRIRERWSDMLRVAGSLHTGTVRAYDLLRMLHRDGHPSRLGQAFAEYGRIAKTLHLLPFIDVDDSYRRQIGAQLNLHESRHQLARKIFHGQRGELRQRYREGQEDQLGALGLVLNAVVLWNTRYMDAALAQLRASDYPLREEDIARLSPLGFKHLNVLGRYTFAAPEPGCLRPLRDPATVEEEDDE